MEETLREVLL